MAENQEINEDAVDRREETLITRHPGYVATEQVVRDVAAERRMGLFQLNRILWSMLVFLEILLAGRFLLRLIAANPDSGFAMLMYGITGVFVGPFNGLISTPTYGGLSLESYYSYCHARLCADLLGNRVCNPHGSGPSKRKLIHSHDT
jgi:hypothetical protein